MSTLNILQNQIEDMTTGSGEWVNVQAPVRLALVALININISSSELSPSITTTNTNSVWKEITNMREDLATRATRVEVAESLRLKADRSSIHHVRTLIENTHTDTLQNELQQQRDIHFIKHDNLLRSEFSAISIRLQNLTDQINSTQAETRLESMETKMIQYRKRRRNTSDKLSKLVADVRANSSQQAETASLFLSGVARLRETLENVRVELDHKSNGAEMRKLLANKAETSELEKLEQFVSSKSVGARFITIEERTSKLENTMQTEKSTREQSERTIESLKSDIEHTCQSLSKEMSKLKLEMEASIEETTKLKHDGASKQSDSQRSVTSFSRRLTQVEEIVERQKPRLHDMGREQTKERARIEHITDSIDHLSKAHKKLENTTISTMTRDVERLKKTMINVERVHAQHENNSNSNIKHSKASAKTTSAVALVVSEKMQSQIDDLIVGMKSNSQKIKKNEENDHKIKTKVFEVQDAVVVQVETFQKHKTFIEEKFQTISHEHNQLHDRCAALETGIRSSLAVLSRPPSLKSLKSNRSHRSHRSHRSKKSSSNGHRSKSKSKSGRHFEKGDRSHHSHHHHKDENEDPDENNDNETIEIILETDEDEELEVELEEEDEDVDLRLTATMEGTEEDESTLADGGY